MGIVVPFSPHVSGKLGVKPKSRKKTVKRREKQVYVGVNVYLDAETDLQLQRVKRNVLHGILSAWDWAMTKGLFRRIFEEGGVFKIRCKQSDIAPILEQIQLRLPDLVARRVRLRAV